MSCLCEDVFVPWSGISEAPGVTPVSRTGSVTGGGVNLRSAW